MGEHGYMGIRDTKCDAWYTMWNQVQHDQTSRTLPRRNHRAHRGRTLESGGSRTAFPRHQTIFRTEACYYRNHATNALAATPPIATHRNRGTHRIPGYSAAAG